MIGYYICYIISYAIYIYSILLVIDAILSWVPFLANSFVGRILNKVVDPYLNLFRKGPIAKLAFSTGIDISPIIAIAILYFIQNLVQSIGVKLVG